MCVLSNGYMLDRYQNYFIPENFSLRFNVLQVQNIFFLYLICIFAWLVLTSAGNVVTLQCESVKGQKTKGKRQRLAITIPPFHLRCKAVVKPL